MLERGVLHILDGQRLMRLVENGCLHGALLRLVGRMLGRRMMRGKMITAATNLSALSPVRPVVWLLVLALLHDGLVGCEVIGVVQHVGRKVPAVDRRICGVSRHGADDGRC